MRTARNTVFALAMLAATVPWAGTAHARTNVILAQQDAAPDVRIVLQDWGAQTRRVEVSGLATLRADEVLVVYHSGPVGRDGDGLNLADRSGRVGIDDWLRESRGRTVLILNICGTNMGVSARDLAAGGDWMVVYPAGGPDCSAESFARSVLLAMQEPARDWPDAMRRAGLAVAQPRPSGATPVMQTVSNDSIVITTLQPVDRGQRIVAQQVAARPADIPGAESAAAMVDGTANRGVLPQRAGLPQPSIIVGEQAIPVPEVSRSATGVPFDDRARIRDENPRIFARMLEEGAFDPDEAQLAAALQTELARMQCYAGAIDGVWGGGSNAAVQRYFQKAGGTPAANLPQVALYRQMIAEPDIVCDPVPVATPATPRGGQQPRPAATRAGARGSAARPAATATQQQGRQPQQQSQPPAASGPPRISPNLSGAGMFR